MPLFIPISTTVVVCFNLPKYAIHRLQKIKNTTARIATRTSRFSQIMAVPKSVHWLPAIYRVF